MLRGFYLLCTKILSFGWNGNTKLCWNDTTLYSRVLIMWNCTFIAVRWFTKKLKSKNITTLRYKRSKHHSIVVGVQTNIQRTYEYINLNLLDIMRPTQLFSPSTRKTLLVSEGRGRILVICHYFAGLFEIKLFPLLYK